MSAAAGATMLTLARRAISRARAAQRAFVVIDVHAFEALLRDALAWLLEAEALLSEVNRPLRATNEDLAERAVLLLANALQKARDAQRLAVHVPNHHQHQLQGAA